MTWEQQIDMNSNLRLKDSKCMSEKGRDGSSLLKAAAECLAFRPFFFSTEEPHLLPYILLEIPILAHSARFGSTCTNSSPPRGHTRQQKQCCKSFCEVTVWYLSSFLNLTLFKQFSSVSWNLAEAWTMVTQTINKYNVKIWLWLFSLVEFWWAVLAKLKKKGWVEGSQQRSSGQPLSLACAAFPVLNVPVQVGHRLQLMSLRHQQHSESTVCIGVQPCWCTRYTFGEVFNDMYPSL